jgi:uncharacterized protein YndB with AHSA1/START domain
MKSPVAKAQMLIRKPVTSNFWFSKGSHKLEVGTQVEWHWEMYGFSVPARVNIIEPQQRILLEWGHTGQPRPSNGCSKQDLTERPM